MTEITAFPLAKRVTDYEGPEALALLTELNAIESPASAELGSHLFMRYGRFAIVICFDEILNKWLFAQIESDDEDISIFTDPIGSFGYRLNWIIKGLVKGNSEFPKLEERIKSALEKIELKALKEILKSKDLLAWRYINGLDGFLRMSRVYFGEPDENGYVLTVEKPFVHIEFGRWVLWITPDEKGWLCTNDLSPSMSEGKIVKYGQLATWLTTELMKPF